MKRKINQPRWWLSVILLLVFAVLFITLIIHPAYASMGWFDTYRYDEAIVNLLDGRIVRGKLDKWWEYENSDMLQVQINGAVYLTHSTNIVLIKKP